MSIFERLFGGREERNLEGGESSKEQEELSLETLNRALNIFISSHRVKVGEEFIKAVIKKAGLSDQETNDMVIASNNVMPENNLSVTANIAYLDQIRGKILNAIEKMNIAEIVE